jgi:hypothetical protein
MLSAHVTLKFADFSTIRFFSADEANKLAERVRKRNVFARHSWENNFYIQRVKSLGDHSVIEVFRDGDPNVIGDKAEQIANSLERITILSSTIAVDKEQLQRKLGISTRPGTVTDFMISSGFRFLRSRARTAHTIQGLTIDERYRNRFLRCGFARLRHQSSRLLSHSRRF